MTTLRLSSILVAFLGFLDCGAVPFDVLLTGASAWTDLALIVLTALAALAALTALAVPLLAVRTTWHKRIVVTLFFAAFFLKNNEFRNDFVAYFQAR